MDAAVRRRGAGVVALVIAALIAWSGVVTGSWGALGRDVGLILGLRLYSAVGYVAVLAATAALARHFLSRPMTAVVVVFTGVSQLANHAIIGWNHTVTTFLMVLAVLFAVSYARTADTSRLLALAAVAGVSVWFRYPMAALLLPVVLYAGWHAWERGQGRSLALAGCIGLSIVAPILLFQATAYGDPMVTAYDLRPQALPPNTKPDLVNSFDPARLIHTVPSMLVRFDPSIPVIDPSVDDFTYRFYKSSLLETSPYLVLAVFGFPLLYRRCRGEALLLAAVCAVPVALYGSWIYFSGGWTTNMRYLSPAVPLLAVMAAAGLPRGVRPDRLSVLLSTVLAAGTIAVVHGMTDVAAVAFVNGLTLSVAALLFAARVGMDRYGLEDVVMLLTVTAVALGAVEVLYLENVKLFYGAGGEALLFNTGAHPLVVLLGTACIGYGLYRLSPIAMGWLRG